MSLAAESVSYCYLDMDETGRVIASWGDEGETGNYRLKILKDGKAVGSVLTVNGTRKDLTYLVAENGPGTYSCLAYLKADGYNAAVTSEPLAIHAEEYLTARKLLKQTPGGIVYRGPASGPAKVPTEVRILLNEGTSANGSVRPVKLLTGSGMTITGTSFSVPFEQWAAGSKVLITVTMAPKEPFDEDMSIVFTCSSAEILRSFSDAEGGTYTVVLSYLPVMRLSAPSGLSVNKKNILR